MSDKSRTKRNAARDAEIRRMAADGCTNAQIARHFGISDARVAQIKYGPDRLAARKDTPAARTQDSAPGGIKPRLKRAQPGHWSCTGAGITRTALTHQAAYQRWLTAIWLASALHHLPRQPLASAPIPAPRPAFPTPTEVKPIRKQQAQHRGKAIDAVAPRQPVPVSAAEPEAPYAGQVTVLPGTAARRPLQLSTALQVNGARAAAAQPRMISIAGSSAREDAA